MDAVTWQEIQEGLLFAFGPLLFWFMALLGTMGVLSAIGVVLLEMSSSMTPR